MQYSTALYIQGGNSREKIDHTLGDECNIGHLKKYCGLNNEITRLLACFFKKKTQSLEFVQAVSEHSLCETKQSEDRPMDTPPHTKK